MEAGWDGPIADEAADLARDFSATTTILNHAGLPFRRDPDALADWRAAMTRFAACPNVVVTLSRMAAPGQPWNTDCRGWIVRSVIEAFGAGRTMFGSNFPVDSLYAGFDEIVSGFKQILAAQPRIEQEAFCCGTASRASRLPGR